LEIDAGSTGNERQILQKPFPAIAHDVSFDGKLLLDQGILPATNGDVFARALDGSQQDTPVLGSPANESHAMLSPDGRLLAYVSNESKRYDVYVRQFPISEGKREWHPSRDGQRFLIANATAQAGSTPITVVLNWAAGLGR
jgi:Tol biopolymer transport system component